ncbi:MAG TPA: UDP-N-acetylmuramoyl-L-alanine--D-glutamate ligase [Ruminococcaceae bacterium]|nr:UDP-N-acetylmuramoyl-L-alanine--D-glutamate ligase [Oscillospiraceae bacterium]
MDSRAAQFFNDIKGKKITLIGIGVSHTDLIKLLAQKGAAVTVCDKRTKEQIGEACGEFEALGVKLRLGDGYLDDLNSADIIFRTPGMRFYMPELNKARQNGIVVTSEMEVFFDLCPCRIFAVTGSDGKTTTTTLISEMLKAQGKTVHLGGNIGKALLPIVESIKPTDYAVVELSSFQLISMRKSPDVAVITNVAPNHLDMHKDMQEYIDAKRNIFIHQNAFSRTVLNADNEITASMANDVRGECLTFSRRGAVRAGAFLDNDMTVCFAGRNGISKIMNASDIRLPGMHNVENYLTAIAAVWGYADIPNMVKVAKEFGGVEHRIEFVRELDGVKWYNDSIATSPTRTIAGLDSFNQKIIVIAGGYDKKIPFEPLAPKIIEKVKVLVLTGATASKIEAAVAGCKGYDPQKLKIIHADDMQDAISKARKAAVKGDVVTLSPACASFDKYPNFEVRGNHYKKLVNELK